MMAVRLVVVWKKKKVTRLDLYSPDTRAQLATRQKTIGNKLGLTWHAHMLNAHWFHVDISVANTCG